MAKKYSFENLTVPVTMAPPSIEYPLFSEGDPNYLEYTQPYAIYTNNYTPATIGATISSSFGTLYCSGDYNYRPSNTGVTLYDRRYSNRPFYVSGSATSGIKYEWDSYAYTYAGYYSELLIGGGRQPISIVTPSKIEKKYFVLGVDVANVESIPLVQQSRYYYVNGAYQDFVSSDQIFLNNGGAGVLPSSPTLNNYRTQVLFDASGSAGWTLVPEASTLERFRPNIYIRSTRYIPAL
jgi:hypothetical protein